MTKVVRFLPDDVSIAVEEGENLLAAAAKAGVYVHAFCGGDGVCGKCKMKIKEGELPREQAQNLKASEYKEGIRLACQTPVVSDMVVEVPEEVNKEGKVLKRKPITTRSISARSLDEIIGKWAVNPPVEKRFLKLDPPTAEDNTADLHRLQRALQKSFGGEQKAITYDHPEMLQENSAFVLSLH